MMSGKRIGHVFISYTMVEDDLDGLYDILKFMEFQPLEITSDAINQQYRYSGSSPLFRALGEGEAAPYYWLEVETVERHIKDVRAIEYRPLHSAPIVTYESRT